MTRAILRRNILYKERGMDKHDLKKMVKLFWEAKGIENSYGTVRI